MSVIGKKPFVNTILDSLTVTQLTTLQGLVNNLGTPTLVALYGNDGIISSSNLGVSYVTFKLEEISQKIVKGILCYKDNAHCGLFVFNDTGSAIDSYQIDPVNKKYIIVNEHLTAAEFRSAIDDEFETESGEVADLEWVNSVKDHITEVEDSIVIDNLKPTVIYLNGKIFPSFPTTGSYDMTIVDNAIVLTERIYENAEMHLTDNATAVALTANTLTKFEIPMTDGKGDGITFSTAESNITIIKTGRYHIFVNFNTSVDVNSVDIEVAVYKNTTTMVTELKQKRTAKNASAIDTSSFQSNVDLVAGDIIDVRVKASLNCNMTVVNANITVNRVS